MTVPSEIHDKETLMAGLLRTPVWFLLALLFLTGTPAPAAETGFTLEQVMSAPFPSDLTAAPKGGAVAWIFNDRGVRNFWVAEPPAYQARRLTNYTEDDGVDLNTPEWTPDGRSLVYVRGGDEENGGEYPNPRSRSKRPEQALWIISLEKGPARRLGEGHSPKVSPAGDRVACVFKDQVWTVDLHGEAKPRQLFEARGRCADLTWSPDGSRLSFVSRRTGHSLIGVYDVKQGSVHYLDPSVDQDSNPVWSPDGKEVVFLREPARRVPAFGPRREGEPWSIRVASPANGKGRALWTAAKGKGSVFHAVRAEHQLFWTAGDRIVFPWERDGWTHLYAIAREGGSPTLLTPGAFEVEYVALSGDRTHLIYSSNQDDIDRRHLWSVAVSGGPATALTSGKGIEWLPVPTPDGKALAFLRSDARRPPRPALQVQTTPARDLAPESIPSDFPEAKLVEPQPVLFSAADGLTLHGQLFLPAGLKAGERRPAVIFFHGGSRRQMLLGWHYMYYYRNAYAFNQYLASRGFVVLSVNYRSGIGYGLNFREALRYGGTGASEYNDVVGAGLWLRGRPEVNGKRIGLWGGSYGGYLTALGLARASDLFAAGVDIHGVYDWSALLRNRLSTDDSQTKSEAARIAYESSPIASVKSWRSPVLVVHGDDDRNVPFSESIHLVEDLGKQQVPLQQLIFPDEIHDFLVHRHWLRMQQASAAFLERWLKGKAGGARARSSLR
jgi:dipeptidyl aminopeptidase/acylaminoacyl peptidase